MYWNLAYEWHLRDASQHFAFHFIHTLLELARRHDMFVGRSLSNNDISLSSVCAKNWSTANCWTKRPRSTTRQNAWYKWPPLQSHRTLPPSTEPPTNLSTRFSVKLTSAFEKTKALSSLLSRLGRTAKGFEPKGDFSLFFSLICLLWGKMYWGKNAEKKSM